MNRTKWVWHPLMEEVGDAGGAGGGAGEPAVAADGGSSRPQAAEPTSAAAAHAAAGQPSGEHGGGAGEPAVAADGGASPTRAAEPTSAAAAHAAAAAKPGGEADGGKSAGGKPGDGDVDLSGMSDEDYAKLVVPDVDGKEGDRSLIGPMSQGLRELGVQPALMQKIAALYSEKVREALAKDDEARAASMRERNARCEAEVTEQQWTDFGAAYQSCIASDPELRHLVDHTELGSSPAFIRLCALAGASLRVERTPPATASAGSGQTDLNRKLFEATVPPNLR